MDIDGYLAKATQGELLSEQTIKVICLMVQEAFDAEPNLLKLKGDFNLVGDIHG
jgi:hypothetical protein